MNPRYRLRWWRNWAQVLPLLARLPRYFLDWQHFLRLGGKAAWRDSYPRLGERTALTPFDPHYFYQAAWLARRLALARPARHVDFASDVRLVGVLSAFVPVAFIDYRPLAVTLPGLACRAGDLLAPDLPARSVDSLSCLHVIEHIGLGRYGDDLDPLGSQRASASLQGLLAPGGRLYVSLPVGRERVCFNAHRVFVPTAVPALFPELLLASFSYVDDAGVFHEDAVSAAAAGNEYACGMYVFTRPA